MTDLEKKTIVALLHKIVSSAVPKASTVEKYGGTLYTLYPDEKGGQFCGIFSYKDHVHLAFGNGAELDDPDSVLKGSGKFRRHLNFKNIDEVDSKAIRRFTKSSAKLS